MRPRVRGVYTTCTSDGMVSEGFNRKGFSIRRRSDACSPAPRFVSKSKQLNRQMAKTLFCTLLVLLMAAVSALRVPYRISFSGLGNHIAAKSTYVQSLGQLPITMIPRQEKSLIDMYLEAMDDPNLYRDSDFSFTADVQLALYRHQNPSSCRSSKFLIYYVFVFS